MAEKKGEVKAGEVSVGRHGDTRAAADAGQQLAIHSSTDIHLPRMTAREAVLVHSIAAGSGRTVHITCEPKNTSRNINQYRPTPVAIG